MSVFPIQAVKELASRAEITISLDFSKAAARVASLDGGIAVVSAQIPAVIDVTHIPDEALGRLWRRFGFDSLANILAKLLHERRPTMEVGSAKVEVYGIHESTTFSGGIASTKAYAMIQVPLSAVPRLAELERRRREAEKKLASEVERVVGVRGWIDEDGEYICLNEDCSRRRRLTKEQRERLKPAIEEYRRTVEEVESAMERGEPVLDFVRSLGRLTVRIDLGS